MERRSVFARLIAALFAFIVFGLGVFFMHTYVRDQFLFAKFNQTDFDTFRDWVLTILRWGGIIMSALTALVVYLLLASRVRARTLAGKLTEELAISLAQFEGLYDNGPVPYFSLTTDGHIYQPNKAALRFFGLTMETMQGMDFFKMIVPDEETLDAKSLAERVKRGIAISEVEMRILRSSGDTRWVLLSLFSVRDPAERKRRSLVALIDITERKNIDRAKTEFVSLVSHQLRTPLAAIKWNTEMLFHTHYELLASKQKEYIEKIYRGNQTMIELVDTLLNVSRIELGGLVVDPKSVTVSALYEDLHKELASKIEQGNLKVTERIEAGLEIITDPKLLRVVLQNLLTNAIRYTPSGGSITVEAVRENDHIIISVSDTGLGIPSEAQGKIFTKMFRADNARAVETHGTGLGLYMSKSFVEALGGTITFESEAEAGTIFTITLPLEISKSATRA